MKTQTQKDKQDKILELFATHKYWCDTKANLYCLARWSKKKIVKKGSLTNSGYIQYSLQYGKEALNEYRHRLVWIYFNGKIPPGVEVNHKDGNKLNCTLKNLELVTRSQNTLHAHRLGLIKPHDVRGELNPKAKLTERDVIAIRRACTIGISHSEIAKKYNITTLTAYRACHKRWQHVPM